MTNAKRGTHTHDYSTKSKPSDIKGLAIGTRFCTKYLNKSRELEQTIERIESAGGIASSELYERYFEATDLYKAFKSSYDAGYRMFQYIKEEMAPTETDEIAKLRQENEELKLQIERMKAVKKQMLIDLAKYVK